MYSRPHVWQDPRIAVYGPASGRVELVVHLALRAVGRESGRCPAAALSNVGCVVNQSKVVWTGIGPMGAAVPVEAALVVRMAKPTSATRGGLTDRELMDNCRYMLCRGRSAEGEERQFPSLVSRAAVGCVSRSGTVVCLPSGIQLPGLNEADPAHGWRRSFADQLHFPAPEDAIELSEAGLVLVACVPGAATTARSWGRSTPSSFGAGSSGSVSVSLSTHWAGSLIGRTAR